MLPNRFCMYPPILLCVKLSYFSFNFIFCGKITKNNFLMSISSTKMLKNHTLAKNFSKLMLIRNNNLWKTLLIELVALNDPLYLDENSITIVLLLSSAVSLIYRRMDFFSLDLVGIFFRPWWRNFLKLTSGLTAPANAIISMSSFREFNITDVFSPSLPWILSFFLGFPR